MGNVGTHEEGIDIDRVYRLFFGAIVQGGVGSLVMLWPDVDGDDPAWHGMYADRTIPHEGFLEVDEEYRADPVEPNRAVVVKNRFLYAGTQLMVRFEHESKAVGFLSLNYGDDEPRAEELEIAQVFADALWGEIPFDQWLAGLAEGAGADYICGIPVDGLLKDESGSVVGIRAGEDEITARVVIDCEGVNSLLAERCLGVARPKPNQMAVGIKEVFDLPAATIEDRFLTSEGEGAAMLFVGDCTHGVVGGGFLYTNRESVSLGLVATISELERSGTTIYQALDDFKRHPAVAPVIRGAAMVEHSGHMVSEGGYDMVPQLAFDGCLIAGDTAMLCMNLGYQVRGMDLAIASGQFAAEAACDSIDAGDVSAAGLASYKEKMDASFVMRDLRTFRPWPSTMEGWGSMFTEYPGLVTHALDAMFVVDGEPQAHLKDRIVPLVKQYGMFKLLREARGALKAL